MSGRRKLTFLGAGVVATDMAKNLTVVLVASSRIPTILPKIAIAEGTNVVRTLRRAIVGSLPMKLPAYIFLVALLTVPSFSSLATEKPSDGDRYTTLHDHDRDGIGKVYMGRQIAQVMGHEGADWLERKERAQEEKPEVVMQLMHLKPGDVVADIGAGSGYYTRRMARAVGKAGKVYAVDIQPEMLQILTNTLSAEGITNVVPTLGTERDPKLPAGQIDLALMVDVYHEFSYPYEMVDALCRALKPGGRLVFVEYRKEDKWVPIKELHKMTDAQVRKEMSVQPLKWEKTVSDQLPWQHFIEFRKVDSTSDAK